MVHSLKQSNEISRSVVEKNITRKFNKPLKRIEEKVVILIP